MQTQVHEQIIRDASFSDWEALRVFLDVASCRSMSAAAKITGMTNSTMSRKIRRLEEAIGKELFERTVRGVRLTANGASLLEVLRRFDHELNSMVRGTDVAREHVGRALKVDYICPEAFAAYWLYRFTPFVRLPNFEFTYNFRNQSFDDLGPVPPFHGRLQMQLPTQNMASGVKLGTTHYLPMASRAYVDEYGVFECGANWQDHKWIEYEQFKKLNCSWDVWFAGDKGNFSPTFESNSIPLVVNAALSGVGIAFLPTYIWPIYPELVVMPFGHQASFGIWHILDETARNSPEVRAADILARVAIDQGNMPWFHDELIVPEQFASLHPESFAGITLPKTRAAIYGASNP